MYERLHRPFDQQKQKGKWQRDGERGTEIQWLAKWRRQSRCSNERSSSQFLSLSALFLPLPKLFTKPRGHVARYPLDSLERLGSVCSASLPPIYTHVLTQISTHLNSCIDSQSAHNDALVCRTHTKYLHTNKTLQKILAILPMIPCAATIIQRTHRQFVVVNTCVESLYPTRNGDICLCLRQFSNPWSDRACSAYWCRLRDAPCGFPRERKKRI